MSGWNTDFTDNFPKTVKENPLSLPRKDDRQALQARIAALLPEPQKADPNAREVLMIEDAAIRVAASKGSPQHAATLEERAERTAALQSVRPHATVKTGKPKPSSAEALEGLKAKLRAMPELERWEAIHAAEEKWSPKARKLLDAAVDDLVAEEAAAHAEDPDVLQDEGDELQAGTALPWESWSDNEEA
jgi:hypothetical protein